MSLIDELLPASFKDIQFLVSSSTLSGGRKTIKKEFPNSNKQLIEDLGLKPRAYTLDAIFTGENYKQERDRLLIALDAGTTGKLVHPFYGTIDNIICVSYTILEDMTRVGDGAISIVFEVSDTQGTPEQSENTINLLSRSRSAVSSAANTNISDKFNVTTAFFGNYENALQKLRGVSSAFTTNINFRTASIDQINSFNSLLVNFTNNITSLVTKPQELADSISALFSGADDLYDEPSDSFQVMNLFFGFGDEDVVFDNNTSGRIERNQNNAAINQSIQAEALSYAYLSAAQIEYTTTEDLNNTTGVLDAQYQKLLDANIDQTLFSTVTDMRVESESFFQQEAVNVAPLVTIKTQEQPARVLSYQYYGSSDFGQIISQVNQDPNVSFLQGDLEVLSVS